MGCVKGKFGKIWDEKWRRLEGGLGEGGLGCGEHSLNLLCSLWTFRKRAAHDVHWAKDNLRCRLGGLAWR